MNKQRTQVPRKSAVLRCRTTPRMREALAEQAQRSELTLSEYVRRLLEPHATKREELCQPQN